ncbi:MAG TPA: hypothetical protein VHI13_16810 [Candidatus Kapabacteria bacterium]|nr:hypothetical protein [Candidatus Kapabacteria bacterium]
MTHRHLIILAVASAFVALRFAIGSGDSDLQMLTSGLFNAAVINLLWELVEYFFINRRYHVTETIRTSAIAVAVYCGLRAVATSIGFITGL